MLDERLGLLDHALVHLTYLYPLHHATIRHMVSILILAAAAGSGIVA